MSHRPAVCRPAKQHGTGQADQVETPGPNFRPARALWPERRRAGHSGFACRLKLPAKGATPKNGVLVPLPPWAKEPAAGAAESSFTGVFLFVCPKRNQKCPGGWFKFGGRMGTSAPTQEGAIEKRGSDRNGHSHVLCSDRAQKRSGASHKVLCQAFFQESGGAEGKRSFPQSSFANFSYKKS